MFETRITKQFGLAAPIINAGMAFVAGPELAAAVADAGGLGMLGGALLPPDGLKGLIEATRKLTKRRFGVDLIGDFSSDAHIDVLVEQRVALAVFFWTAPTPAQIARLKSARVAFWMQVGSVEEARAAALLGAEALVVQGSEAGGHNRAEATLANLLPAVRAALPDMALVAAGGITDGASMVGALARGAEAVWCGTRFLASREADAHDGYKSRVVAAGSGDTALTTVFGPEWPDQPVRALVNEAVRRSAGREKAALAEAAGDMIGTTRLGGQAVPVPRYSALLPTRSFDADLEWSCLTAGESAANIQTVEPAGAILRAMMQDAEQLLGSLAQAAE
jgi:NAD(P)H-dependent flavin oxidoreductase YrpB (nitropropane dioxygenase family)